MALNETHRKFHIGKFSPGTFPIQCGIKQGYTISPLHFSVALECAIRKVQENQVGLK
jgi:hypothetical protein